MTTDLIRSVMPEPAGLAPRLAGLGVVGGVRRRSRSRKDTQAQASVFHRPDNAKSTTTSSLTARRPPATE